MKIELLFEFTDINKYEINITPEKQIPKKLEKEINNSWAELTKEKPKMTNGEVLFVQDINYENENVVINAEKKGFSKLHFFNRREENHKRIQELTEFNMLGISTHTHILSNDNYLLFGTKKNQFDQISGFGGFPQKEDYSENKLNPFNAVRRSVGAELSTKLREIAQTPIFEEATGITYVDHTHLRGTDMDFLIKLDANAKKIQESFEENSQFAKKLYRVNFEPEAVARFIKETFSEGKTISPYMLGAQLATQNKYFGKDAQTMVLNAIHSSGIDAIVRDYKNWSIKELNK